VPRLLTGAEDLSVRGHRPKLPPNTRIYAVGDIHGCLDLLDRVLTRAHADCALRPVARCVYVFLGDYIDRGPSSLGTIDRLIEHAKSNESVFLRGNHESIALKCLSDRTGFDQWLRLGGLETLASYGIAAQIGIRPNQIAELQAAFHSALPPVHLRFFRDLKNSFVCGDFFFAHAGVKPNIELSRQQEKDLLWIRSEFLSSNEDFGRIIVHGHTPTSEIEVAPNRINIDTGAFATGRLTCLVIEQEQLSVIDTSLTGE
jgi:serine/threonine protein phosphatase 1